MKMNIKRVKTQTKAKAIILKKEKLQKIKGGIIGIEDIIGTG